MPGKGKLPKLIEWWAGRIRQENPHLSVQESIAIAVAQAQKHGYLKKGTLELTEKGRQYSKKYYGAPLPLDIKRVYRQEKKSGKAKKGRIRLKIRKALEKKAQILGFDLLKFMIMRRLRPRTPFLLKRLHEW